MKSIFLDLEWRSDGVPFIVGYAYNLRDFGQLLEGDITPSAVSALFSGVSHVYVYGPDVAVLEKFYDLNLRQNYVCINLLTAAKAVFRFPNYRLSTVEKALGLSRKADYKERIFQLYSDFGNAKNRAEALQYNLDDVLSLVRLKRLLQTHVGVRQLTAYQMLT